MNRAARLWDVAGIIVSLALLVCGLFYYFDKQYARAACFFVMNVIATNSGSER